MAKILKLRRVVGLPLLVLYGLGNILGAGIYVLIGPVAAAAGYGVIYSFAGAFAIAALTAFSYMELSSRYPQTAGVPVYLHKAFGRPLISAVVGWLLIGAGVVSAATLSKGFVGYFQNFTGLPGWVIILGLIALLCATAAWGISQSARLAAVLTVLEVGGLLLVIRSTSAHLSGLPQLAANLGPAALGPGVVAGAFIAFYAFIGFEDMIEIAEEVKDPPKTLPRAIFVSLLVAAVLYLLVVSGSLLVLTPEQLAASQSPLAQVYQAAIGEPSRLLAAIGSTAIINGVLAQIIMGSRMMYGLASKGWVHEAFGRLSPARRTPVRAIMLMGVAIAALSLTFPLVRLAEATSFLTLTVFAMVNASLLVVKRRGSAPGRHQVPFWVPAAGLASSAAILVYALLLI